jgi:hypothetical protein
MDVRRENCFGLLKTFSRAYSYFMIRKIIVTVRIKFGGWTSSPPCYGGPRVCPVESDLRDFSFISGAEF